MTPAGSQVVKFKVFGTPTPQGSKTRMPNGAIIEGRSTGQRALHTNWRSAVADAANDLVNNTLTPTPLGGPLVLFVTFRFPMPKSRRKADRERGWCHKTSAPDLDKLIRSIGDALKAGGLIADDALFVDIHAMKIEVAEWTGATIEIWEAA